MTDGQHPWMGMLRPCGVRVFQPIHNSPTEAPERSARLGDLSAAQTQTHRGLSPLAYYATTAAKVRSPAVWNQPSRELSRPRHDSGILVRAATGYTET